MTRLSGQTIAKGLAAVDVEMDLSHAIPPPIPGRTTDSGRLPRPVALGAMLRQPQLTRLNPCGATLRFSAFPISAGTEMAVKINPNRPRRDRTRHNTVVAEGNK